MLYLLGIITAALIVCGQALWKMGVERSHFELTSGFVFSPRIFSLIFSPYVLVGMAIYALATLIFMAMLSKYEYSVVQGLVVPLSLIATFIVARFFFHDRITSINYLGLGILIVGIILVVRR